MTKNINDNDLSNVNGGFGTGAPGPYKFTKGEKIYVDQSHMGSIVVLEDVDTEDKNFIVHCNTYFNDKLKISNLEETAGHLANYKKYFN